MTRELEYAQRRIRMANIRLFAAPNDQAVSLGSMFVGYVILLNILFALSQQTQYI